MAIFTYVGQDANNTTSADTLVVNNSDPLNFTINSGAEGYIGDQAGGINEAADDRITYTDYDGNTYTNETFIVTYVGRSNWANGNSAIDPAASTRIAIIQITSGAESGQTYTMLLSAPFPPPAGGNPFNTFKNGNHRASPNEATTFCFAEGTMIRTPEGDVAIEDLAMGDLVETRSNGSKAIRWIGSVSVVASGVNQPIRIAKGALGQSLPNRDLVLSPAHRMLISGTHVELLFDKTEVLVHAKDLVNDHTIRPVDGKLMVTYYHMLFDEHEIVFANGAPSESLNPSEALDNAAARETADELLRLFPNLHAETQYKQSVGQTLSSAEGKILSRM